MFIHEDFLLTNNIAKELFHDHAANLPVIDYHCHLSPKDIAEDRQFRDISEAWLEGDHYKWRIMRANGTGEKWCSGDAPGYEKFMKYAETLPLAIGNPIYHWSHLELKRYFGIDEILNPATANKIWERANILISDKSFSIQNLLRMMKVETLCTTDDPVDNLKFHKQIKETGFEINILPTFRPDKAMNITSSPDFIKYMKKLELASETEIKSYDHLLIALAKRIDYFNLNGCRISDHAFTSMPAITFSTGEIRKIFEKVSGGKEVTPIESDKFRIAVMTELGKIYSEKGWTMQIHLGALRNTNSRIMKKLGPDVGADSLGDEPQAQGLSMFLDSLDRENKLTSTILYNLNPSDNEVLASMAGNFQGCMPGKIQYGAAWWFLDNKDGIERHLRTVANFGLLGRFIGMLTDSRSFLSYPRHEYFRRILANLLGNMAEAGEIPSDTGYLSHLIRDISYNNVKNYFNF